MAVRALMRRSAAARAADDIRWPETITTEGDRAALYPEPTRPSAGHGLGLAEDDDEPGRGEMPEMVNMAGAGAGTLRLGPSQGVTRSPSATTSGLASATTSGLGSATHYMPFDYPNASEYGYGPGSYLPPLVTGNGLGLGTQPSTSHPSGPPAGQAAYPADWNQEPTRTTPYRISPNASVRAGAPTDYLGFAQDRRPDEEERLDQRGYPGYQSRPDSQLPYTLPYPPEPNSYPPSPPRPSPSHDRSRSPNPGGPREIQYAAYPHGGYGGMSDDHASPPEIHRHPTTDRRSHVPTSTDDHELAHSDGSETSLPRVEWKLGVNNPDQED